MEQLVLIDRDAAKQLFRTHDPDDLVQFVQDLAADPRVSTLRLPDRWPEWDKMFHDADVAPTTLQWALAGGRDMDVGDSGNRIQLKRPDVVVQIAEAIRQFGKIKRDDDVFGTALELFYATAAEGGSAVLFVSWPQEASSTEISK